MNAVSSEKKLWMTDPRRDGCGYRATVVFFIWNEENVTVQEQPIYNLRISKILQGSGLTLRRAKAYNLHGFIIN